MLAVITVDSALDNTNADGLTTLREAVNAANVNMDADIIRFALPANQKTITLTQGALDINNSLTIDAQHQGITIDASGNDVTPNLDDGQGSRIFRANSFSVGLELVLKGLKLTGGDESTFGGAVFFDGHGTGSLSVIDTIVEDNFSSSQNAQFV